MLNFGGKTTSTYTHHNPLSENNHPHMLKKEGLMIENKLNKRASDP